MSEMDLEGLLGNDRIVHVCGSPTSRMRQATWRWRAASIWTASESSDSADVAQTTTFEVTLQFTEHKGRGTGA
jgi:hypothetical protein